MLSFQEVQHIPAANTDVEEDASEDQNIQEDTVRVLYRKYHVLFDSPIYMNVYLILKRFFFHQTVSAIQAEVVSAESLNVEQTPVEDLNKIVTEGIVDLKITLRQLEK